MRINKVKFCVTLVSMVLSACNSGGSNLPADNNVNTEMEQRKLIDMKFFSEHPLTIEELSESKFQNQNINFGENTNTFIRCYYKEYPDDRKPSTKYIFAKQQNDYYRLPGYWYVSSGWQNMFYTSISLAEIKRVCDETINANPLLKGRKSTSQFAANNKGSFNHTIWSMTANGNLIHRIVSFGDSLSDTNNMYNISNWQLPNKNSWFQGRFSNGPAWVVKMPLICTS